MHFTREPTVETVITPREGHKLVVRSSRGGGTEEYFIDALEVVVFGTSCFFRSLERPKCFLLPVRDYEVLEVRETRTVLKAVAVQKEKSSAKPSKSEPAADDKQLEKKRERRRQRRRKGADEEASTDEETPVEQEADLVEEPKPVRKRAPRKPKVEKVEDAPDAPEKLPKPKPDAEPPKSFDTLIPPPAMLISERIGKYEKPEEPVAAAEPAPAEPAPAENEAPELVPPEEKSEKSEEGFSPSRLFRRFRGGEESSTSDEEK